MDLHAFSASSLPQMDMGQGGDSSSGPPISADALWKRFDDPAMASQLSMFPFSNSQASPASSNLTSGTNTVSTDSASASQHQEEASGKEKTSKRGSTANKAESSGKSSSKATKKARGSLSEQEKLARREKHNQVEIRRRKRINQRFSELGDICGCDSKQKRNILTSAIDKLKEYEERIQQLKNNLESLALDDNADAGGDTDEKQDGDLQFQQDLSVVDHRSVFMKSGVPLHVSGFDGRILDCNERFAQLFGFTREVILANQVTVFSLTAPDSLAVTFGVVGHLMKGNPRAQVDNLMIGPGGRLIKVKVTAWLIRDNGRPKYFMSMMVPDPNFQSPVGSAAAAPLQLQAGATVAPAPSASSMMAFMPASNNVVNQSASMQMAPLSAQQQQQQAMQLSLGPLNSGVMRNQSGDFMGQQLQQVPQQQQPQQQLLLQQLMQMQQAQLGAPSMSQSQLPQRK